MRLVPVQKVLEKLVYSETITDIRTASISALDTTTEALAGELRTEFGAGSFTDIFFVNRSMQLDVSQAHARRATRLFETEAVAFTTKLFLSRGFVKATPAVIVASALSRADLDGASATDIASASHVNLERGVVTVTDKNLSGLYVKVTYAAGFDVDSDDEDVYDQGQVPSWLRELAVAHAAIEVSGNPSLFVGTDDDVFADSKRFAVRLESRTVSVIQSKIRYVPDAVHPLF